MEKKSDLKLNQGHPGCIWVENRFFIKNVIDCSASNWNGH